ncbi:MULTISPECIES: DHH family phosphoesterase [unclassified Bradyrhizobium]|uniref:DHH family phosphoesterase n=1 Tax=Bradyrhizobium TaxID=374 RepID=UPI0028ED024B|nr:MULTISPECIES: DHH family phosphoesterase [unclassified Bradyrhizobium]
MNAIIVSYFNPDLDGVACSIALAALEYPALAARVLGNLDRETRLVLDTLDLPIPLTLTDWSNVEVIWLVDTHHPKQLPAGFPAHLVTQIIDHHPGGSPETYPHAEIQNEAVGAAATLVAERFERRSVNMPAEIAVLLQAAILSNTLEFSAPATSNRDRRANESLARIRPLDLRLLDGMRQIRREKVLLATDVLLNSDAKVFETRHGQVVIAQVEAPGALQILSRPDLIPAMRQFAASRNTASAVLNLVDTEAGKSAVLATDEQVLGIIASALRSPIDARAVVKMDRILQRKTDIIPFIVS